MQLGFVSAILPDLSLEEVLDVAVENGFDYMEVMCGPWERAERCYACVTHVDVAGFERTAARRVRDMVE